MNLKWLTIYFFIMCEIILIKCVSENENSFKHEKVKEDFGFLNKVIDRFVEFFKKEGDKREELLQIRSANNKTIINVQIIKLDKKESKSRKQRENARLNDIIFNTTSSSASLNSNTKTTHNTQIVISSNTSERKEKTISSTISSLLSIEEISTVLALNENVLQNFESFTVHNLSQSPSNKYSGYTYEKPITPFSINLLQNNNSDLTPFKNDNLREGLLKKSPYISLNNDNQKIIRHTDSTNATQNKTKPKQEELGTILHLNSSTFDKIKIKNNVSKVSNTFFADNVTVDTQKNISKNINPEIKNNNVSSNASWVMKIPKKNSVNKLPTTTDTNELEDYLHVINKSETSTNLKQIRTSTSTTNNPITLESTKTANSNIPKSNVTSETLRSDFSNVTKYETETNSDESLPYLQSSTKKPKDLIKPNNKSVIPISLKHDISANNGTTAKKMIPSLNQNDTSSIQNANATESTKQVTSSTALPFNSYNILESTKTTNSKIPKSNVTSEILKSDFSNVTKYVTETNSDESLAYFQSSTKKPKDLIKQNNKSVIPISLKHDISANNGTSTKKMIPSMNQNDTSSIQNANATENTKQVTSSTALPFNSYNILESTKTTNSKIPKSNVTSEILKSDFSNVTKYVTETNSDESLAYFQSSTKKPKDLIKQNNKSVIPISLKHDISANNGTSTKKMIPSMNQNDTSSIQNANATENTKQVTSSTALPFNSYNNINKNKIKVTNKQDIVGLSSSQKQNITTKTPIPKPATTTNRPLNSSNKIIVVQKENKMEIATNKPTESKIITDSLDQAYHKLYDDNEILQDEKFEYLDVDGATDYPNIDYIEIYKDTTNEDVQYLLPQETTTLSSFNEINKEIELMTNKIQNVLEYTVSNKSFASDNDKLDSCASDLNATDIDSTLSWIAAIFIKNGTSNRFDYYCDGALLSQSVILTAARCVSFLNKTVDSNDIIVLLGKRSLHDTSPEEMVHRVHLIQIHDNFIIKGDVVKNDLALLHLEDVAKYSKDVRPACFQDVGDSKVDVSSTFGWKVSGELRPVYFVSSSENCKRNKLPDLICATYGNEVKICPNHGGLYVVKTDNKWILKGIRHGDTSDREFCFDKDVIFTDLDGYRDWINLFSKV